MPTCQVMCKKQWNALWLHFVDRLPAPPRSIRAAQLKAMVRCRLLTFVPLVSNLWRTTILIYHNNLRLAFNPLSCHVRHHNGLRIGLKQQASHHDTLCSKTGLHIRTNHCLRALPQVKKMTAPFRWLTVVSSHCSGSLSNTLRSLAKVDVINGKLCCLLLLFRKSWMAFASK